MGRVTSATALAVALLGAGGVGACQGCHTPPAVTAEQSSTTPTVRLYVISTLAGALEPCGCTKDQLGGVDHLAAFVAAEAQAAPNRLVLGAGPLLFEDPILKGDDTTQASWKADAIALAAKDIGLAAWAPGVNDWAAGTAALASYRDETGAKLLAGNLTGAPGAASTMVREIGGIKVGVVGVSDPRNRIGVYPDAVKETSPLEAMKAGVAEVEKQGARVLVGLAALPRGEALRLADELPQLHVLLLGKPFESGESNDAQKPPVLVGSTLVVETANHLQTVAVIDLFVRDAGSPAGRPLVFADAGGVAKADELLSLAGRIRDLEARINSWERDKTVKPEDVAARKGDLQQLRDQKAKLEEAQPPVPGSFFRYTSVEVRDRLGKDAAVAGAMDAYYKRVNEHNKTAFADRKPPAPEPGQASYVGVEACSFCHEEPRKVWDGTPHSHAYATLKKDSKEYNLDCVSCHVSGYGKAGGSTVTFNDKLEDVQCEECHGPGSLHVKDPKKKGLVTAKPSLDACVSSCHHPPHVEGFDAKEKVKLILGPGHGMPLP
jgi:hypothetical protein